MYPVLKNVDNCKLAHRGSIPFDPASGTDYPRRDLARQISDVRLEHRQNLMLWWSTFAVLYACGIQPRLPRLRHRDAIDFTRSALSTHRSLCVNPSTYAHGADLTNHRRRNGHTGLTTPRKDSRLRWEGTEALPNGIPRAHCQSNLYLPYFRPRPDSYAYDKEPTFAALAPSCPQRFWTSTRRPRCHRHSTAHRALGGLCRTRRARECPGSP
ncbi:hypothetical protein HYPSUDRAFT_44761 [Hypholoma sublateritium FD-334 SS-4]|uniref:Uncharacterized protein n=1 Tax=Hypholoma sublateritium (strain FD-334 SS-4) TaxID=945553 RepID=A0A0D2NQ63_HYPSF|nr:hypothetical protein HYPSUDRAFT_44761 [Hypholoma sublateritium FD-334 SS-4]